MIIKCNNCRKDLLITKNCSKDTGMIFFKVQPDSTIIEHAVFVCMLCKQYFNSNYKDYPYCRSLVEEDFATFFSDYDFYDWTK